MQRSLGDVNDYAVGQNLLNQLLAEFEKEIKDLNEPVGKVMKKLEIDDFQDLTAFQTQWKNFRDIADAIH